MGDHDSAMEMTDARLLGQVLRGATEAFAPLVRRHLPSVRAFVALKLPVAHLIDEITHETFVFAFRHIGQFDAQLSFRAWLKGIAWTLLRSELQRFAREQGNLSRLQQAQYAHWSRSLKSEIASDEAVYLEECLANLPETMRRLVEEFYCQEASVGEIAQRQGRTEAWVRVTLFRVRKQLRSCIETKLARSSYAT